MIYLDNHATTQIDPGVCDDIDNAMRTIFANPHSTSHILGWQANDAVENARSDVAKCIGAKSTDVIFTSGATEANNIFIKGVAFSDGGGQSVRRKILVSSIEHSCVLESAKYMADHNIGVEFIPVGKTGRVDMIALEGMLDESVALVSVMMVNNEIGTIQDIKKISTMAHAVGALMHSDIAQALGRVEINMKNLGLDAVSISAHKIYGPKGIGALVLRRGVTLLPLFSGGGQEKGLRSGTLSPPLCIGFGRACVLATKDILTEQSRTASLRDLLQEIILSSVDSVRVLGDINNRISGSLSLFFSGIDADNFFSKLRGLAISTGSACSSAKSGGSHVLRSIGMDAAEQGMMLRICVGRFNSIDDVRDAGALILVAIKDLESS